jgi:UDP-glucose 4-epimerase
LASIAWISDTAVKNGVRQFIFSSTCAVCGNPAQVPVAEDTLPAPISPWLDGPVDRSVTERALVIDELEKGR